MFFLERELVLINLKHILMVNINLAATDTTDYTNSSTEASIGRRYSGVEFLEW